MRGIIFLLLVLKIILANDIDFQSENTNIRTDNISGYEIVNIHSDSLILLKSGINYYISDLNGINISNIYTIQSKDSKVRSKITRDGKYVQFRLFYSSYESETIAININNHKKVTVNIPNVSVSWLNIDDINELVYFNIVEPTQPKKLCKLHIKTGFIEIIGDGGISPYHLSPSKKHLISKSSSLDNIPPNILAQYGVITKQKAKQLRSSRIEDLKSGKIEYPYYRIMDTNGNNLLSLKKPFAKYYIKWSNLGNKILHYAKDGYYYVITLELSEGKISILNRKQIVSSLPGYYIESAGHAPFSPNDEYIIVYLIKYTADGHNYEDVKIALYPTSNKSNEMIPLISIGSSIPKNISPVWTTNNTILAPHFTNKTFYKISIEER